LDDFGETFASFPACDKGGEMLHVFGEVKDVLHAGGMREILKHRFVVGRIPAEDETTLLSSNLNPHCSKTKSLVIESLL